MNNKSKGYFYRKLLLAICVMALTFASTVVAFADTSDSMNEVANYVISHGTLDKDGQYIVSCTTKYTGGTVTYTAEANVIKRTSDKLGFTWEINSSTGVKFTKVYDYDLIENTVSEGLMVIPSYNNFIAVMAKINGFSVDFMKNYTDDTVISWNIDAVKRTASASEDELRVYVNYMNKMSMSAMANLAHQMGFTLGDFGYSSMEAPSIADTGSDDKKDDDIKDDEIVNPNPFTDVKNGEYYTDAILYLNERKVMTGFSATVFGFGKNLTREDMISLLWKKEGKPNYEATLPTFKDIQKGKYYANAVIWGKENKICSGFSATEFGVGKNITRQDFVKIIYGYAKYKGYDISVKSATSYMEKRDAKLVADYAAKSINWGYENGFIGKGATLDPTKPITREDAAVIISRFIKKYDPIVTEPGDDKKEDTVVTYKINYVLDGGTNNGGNPGEYSSENTQINLLDPSKAGYIFEGWYLDANYNTKITSIDGTNKADITVYAKWRKEYNSALYKKIAESNKVDKETGYKYIGQTFSSSSVSSVVTVAYDSDNEEFDFYISSIIEGGNTDGTVSTMEFSLPVEGSTSVKINLYTGLASYGSYYGSVHAYVDESLSKITLNAVPDLHTTDRDNLTVATAIDLLAAEYKLGISLLKEAFDDFGLSLVDLGFTSINEVVETTPNTALYKKLASSTQTDSSTGYKLIGKTYSTSSSSTVVAVKLNTSKETYDFVIGYSVESGSTRGSISTLEFSIPFDGASSTKFVVYNGVASYGTLKGSCEGYKNISLSTITSSTTPSFTMTSLKNVTSTNANSLCGTSFKLCISYLKKAFNDMGISLREIGFTSL